MAQPTNSFRHFYVPNKKKDQKNSIVLFTGKNVSKMKMYSDIYDLLFGNNEIKNGKAFGHQL